MNMTFYKKYRKNLRFNSHEIITTLIEDSRCYHLSQVVMRILEFFE
jgi:hypothetical protein